MRPSKKKHTLAVLRRIIGLNQTEMAELMGCSKAAVQSIELGRLKLSDKLLEAVVLKTGISPKWLLDGDPEMPPVTTDGKTKFTQDFYQKNTLSHEAGGAFSKIGAEEGFKNGVRELAIIFAAAYAKGEIPLADYLVKQAASKIKAKIEAPELFEEIFGAKGETLKSGTPKEVEKVFGWCLEAMLKPGSEQRWVAEIRKRVREQNRETNLTN